MEQLEKQYLETQQQIKQHILDIKQLVGQVQEKKNKIEILGKQLTDLQQQYLQMQGEESETKNK